MPAAHEVLKDAEAILRASPNIDHHPGKARIESEELLAFVLGHAAEPDEEVHGRELRRFRRTIERRATGEPAALVTGHIEFNGLTLAVGPGAFIPRHSSAFLADQAVRRLRARRGPVHVDLATGVGPVALSVASAVPAARVFGVDLSAKPVALARRNARSLELSNATFLRGDLFAPLSGDLLGAVDVITIHPPYVRRREMRTLPQEIRGFEPSESLTDGSSAGTVLLGRAAGEAPAWLRAGGWILVEVSPDRSREVATILRRAGFAQVRSTKGDLPVTRVVVGRR